MQSNPLPASIFPLPCRLQWELFRVSSQTIKLSLTYRLDASAASQFTEKMSFTGTNNFSGLFMKTKGAREAAHELAGRGRSHAHWHSMKNYQLQPMTEAVIRPHKDADSHIQACSPPGNHIRQEPIQNASGTVARRLTRTQSAFDSRVAQIMKSSGEISNSRLIERRTVSRSWSMADKANFPRQQRRRQSTLLGTRNTHMSHALPREVASQGENSDYSTGVGCDFALDVAPSRQYPFSFWQDKQPQQSQVRYKTRQPERNTDNSNGKQFSITESFLAAASSHLQGKHTSNPPLEPPNTPTRASSRFTDGSSIQLMVATANDAVCKGGFLLSHSVIDFGEVAVGGIFAHSVSATNTFKSPIRIEVQLHDKSSLDCKLTCRAGPSFIAPGMHWTGTVLVSAGEAGLLQSNLVVHAGATNNSISATIPIRACFIQSDTMLESTHAGHESIEGLQTDSSELLGEVRHRKLLRGSGSIGKLGALSPKAHVIRSSTSISNTQSMANRSMHHLEFFSSSSQYAHPAVPNAQYSNATFSKSQLHSSPYTVPVIFHGDWSMHS